jgi:hypothetical protein
VNGTVYDPTYAFTVISPSGADVSPNMANVNASGSGQDHLLGPGKTLIITFNLSVFCNFDEPGNYKVTAQRKEIWSTPKKVAFTVISNPLTVTVTN